MAYLFWDLFACGGGATEGLKQAGMKPTGAVEWDKVAAETYRMNHGDHVLNGDIRNLDWVMLKMSFGGATPTHMHFSPPCQDFSINGRQEGFEGDRGGLMWEPIRLLEEAAMYDELPLTISMENVKGLVQQKHIGTFLAWVSALERLGYAVDWKIINMAEYGVPQTRERLILVGSRLGRPHLPVPTHPSKEQWVTGAEALGVLDKPYYFVDDAYNKPSRDGKPRVYDLATRPAPTIDARTGARPKLGPSMDKLARGTVTDWKKLQAFPPHYKFAGAPGRQSQQIGNACPPLFFKHLGAALVEHYREVR